MKPTRPAAQTVLVMMPLDMETGRGILRGIRDYARTRTDAAWVFQVWYPHFPLNTLRHAARPDGVIAHLHRWDWVEAVRQLDRRW